MSKCVLDVGKCSGGKIKHGDEGIQQSLRESRESFLLKGTFEQRYK